MVIALFGESCTGKSTIAERLRTQYDVRLFTGKDYIKLAKHEPEAIRLFTALLRENQETKQIIVYVISETEQLGLLPERALRVLFTAELESKKARFAGRMNGKLPPPVAAMLEKKHGMFDQEPHDLHVRTDMDSEESVCAAINQRVTQFMKA